MTESIDPNGRPVGLPASVSYDPAREAAPVASPEGTLVLLLSDDADPEWAADAALALCADWSRHGERVVLADVQLESPVLHERAGVDNLIGVVDVLLYGASVGASSRPVEGAGFYLIPTGTYEPDAASVFGHPRWAKLVAGFRDASASLVLFASAAEPEVAEIAEWIDRLIVLGDPERAPALRALVARGVTPEAVLVPPPARQPGDAEVVETAEAREAEALTMPPEPERAAPRDRKRLATIAAVVVAAAVFALAGFLLARSRPDLVPWAGAAGADRQAEQAAPPEPAPAEQRTGPSRTGALLPYSVTGWAFMTLDAARAHAEQQRARFTAAPFFVSPEEIEGVLYYKVLAGAAVDTAAAARLRAQLVESGTIEPTESIIQFAPLAFDLGELREEDAAEARADSLGGEDVPAYVVPVPYSDGTRRWQLYGGAFRDSASAEAMRRILAEAGMPSRLVARIGAAGPPSP